MIPIRSTLWVGLTVFALSGCALFRPRPTTFTNMRETVQPQKKTVVLGPTWCSDYKYENAANRHLYQLAQRGLSEKTGGAVARDTLPCGAFDEPMMSSWDTRQTGWYGLVTFDDKPEDWAMRLAQKEVFQKYMAQQQAEYALATWVMPVASCREKVTTFRDSSGRDIGSMASGQVNCFYSGQTRVAQLLINPEGTAVWRSVRSISTESQTYDKEMTAMLGDIPVHTFAGAPGQLAEPTKAQAPAAAPSPTPRNVAAPARQKEVRTSKR